MQAKFKALILISAFFLLYLVFGAFNYLNYGIINNGQDWAFHFDRINGIDDGRNYPSLYHYIFSYFKDPFLFYVANLILILVLTPVILFLITEKFETLAVYFMAVPLVHMEIFGATFPQAFVILLLLLYILNRLNITLFFVLLFLATYSHSKGSILFFGILLIELAIIFFKNFKPHYFVFLNPDKLSLESLGHYLMVLLPVPLLYFAFKEFQTKAHEIYAFFGALLVLSVIGSFIDIRAVCIAQLMLCFLVGEQFFKMKGNLRKGFWLLIIVLLIWNLYDYGLGTWKLIYYNLN